MELFDLFFRLTNRFRITYSLKILSKSNHSSKHNSFQSRTRVSTSRHILRIIIPSQISSKTIDQSFSITSSYSPPLRHKFISDTVRTIPQLKSLSRYLFHQKRKKKKEKSLHPPYISLSHPWTLISNLKQFPISFWNRSENQSTASSKRKKGREGKKLLPTIPNLYKPSYRIYLHVRSSSTSIGTTVCERGHRSVNPNIRFSLWNRSDPL